MHGNVRKNPKLSGTAHNVFGIQVGVGITVLVRNSQSSERFIRYHRVPEFDRNSEKLEWLAKVGDIGGVEWQTLSPNAKNAWLTEGLEADFETFVPMGTQAAKAGKDNQTIFAVYGGGLKSNRDSWVYNYNRERLAEEMGAFVSAYNMEVERWVASDKKKSINDFVTNDDAIIKWDSTLKKHFNSMKKATLDEAHIREAIYRPFCKQYLYFDRMLNNSVHLLPKFFPTHETENRVICVTAPGNQGNFHCLMTDCIPDLHLTGDSQCFPLYTFSADGKQRFDNITGTALERVRAQFGAAVSREDLFYAVYALLHAPAYRAKFAENLKRELPRLPLDELPISSAQWAELVEIGRALGALHVGYENAPPAKLTLRDTTRAGDKYSFRVEKMRWNKDKSLLFVNDSIEMSGFTEAMFDYKLGNRSALDWVVESYRVKSDARSGLTSDPNRASEPMWIPDLIKRVASVSLQTGELVARLPNLFVE